MKLLIFLLLFSLFFTSACVKDKSTLIDSPRTTSDLNEEAKIKKRVDSYMNLAVNALRKQNYPLAYENLFKALKLNDSDKDLHNLIGLTYLYDGKEARAIKSFKNAIKIDPKYSEAHNHLGIVYSEIEEYKSAIKHFKKALDNLTYKTPWIAYTNLGRAYMLNGDSNKAIKAIQKSLSKNTRQCVPYQILGKFNKNNKNYYDAKINYENAIKYCKIKEIEHLNLGVVFLTNKKYQESKKQLDLCVEIAKTNSNTRVVDECKRYLNLLEE